MQDAETIINFFCELKKKIEDTPATSTESHLKELIKVLTSTYDYELARQVRKHPDFSALNTFFSVIWNAFFLDKEKLHSKEIIAGVRPAGIKMSEEKHLANYHVEFDELKMLKMQNQSGEFINIACGAFPESLMQAYQRLSYSEFIGLDFDAEAIDTSRKVAPLCLELFQTKRLVFKCIPAEEYDYSSARVVFIMNSARNKKDIMQRILQTMPDDGVIIARNPPRLGRIIYEDMFEDGGADGFEVFDSIEKNALVTVYALRKFRINSGR